MRESDRRKLSEYPPHTSQPTSHKCLKKTLHCFNILFLITGLGTVAVGAWLLIQFGRFDVLFGIYKFLHPCGMMISAGGLAVLVMCCGAWSIGNRHQCCLRSYISFLILILTAQFVAGGLAFSYRSTVKAEITTATVDVVLRKYGSGDRGLDYTIDILQARYQCCGALSALDYKKSLWIQTVWNATKKVPESCCSDPRMCALRTDQSLVYSQGCIPVLYDLTDLRFMILGGVGIGVGCLLFVGLCLTWYYTIIL